MDKGNLETFGAFVREWRRLSKLSTVVVADRAGITRDSLRALETGTGGIRLENVFAVLEALGLDSKVVSALDPSADDRGLALLRRAAERKHT